MTIILKSRKDIDHLRSAGRIVAQTYEVLSSHVRPGVSTAELDRIAETYIRSQGGFPTYKGYRGHLNPRGEIVQKPFPATLCVAVNDAICHGIPSHLQILEDGDIIGIDIGVTYRGWIGDSCVTFGVGSIDSESQRLLDVTRTSLQLGIDQVKIGSQLGDIGAAISEYVLAQGFSVVHQYGGHGVGRNLHEEPFVPHYGRRHSGIAIVPGMVFTIEPMVNAGRPETRVLSDHWCVATADGSRSAQFEHTLAVTQEGVEVLTSL